MPLDPQIQAYLAQMTVLSPAPLDTISPEMARLDIKMELAGTSDELEPVAHIEDRVISGPES